VSSRQAAVGSRSGGGHAGGHNGNNWQLGREGFTGRLRPSFTLTAYRHSTAHRRRRLCSFDSARVRTMRGAVKAMNTNKAAPFTDSPARACSRGKSRRRARQANCGAVESGMLPVAYSVSNVAPDSASSGLGPCSEAPRHGVARPAGTGRPCATAHRRSLRTTVTHRRPEYLAKHDLNDPVQPRPADRDDTGSLG
jgi:hypothetical protein